MDSESKVPSISSHHSLQASPAKSSLRDDVTAEDKALIASLVESQRISSCIKMIVERGWKNQYEQILDNHIDAKDQEIKQICQNHYEEFIGSIDGLVTLKAGISGLKADVLKLNSDIQDKGRQFLKEANRLMRYRKQRWNIENALTTTQTCHRIVSHAKKAQTQIKERKYVPALKALEQLRRVHLPRFQGYEFAQRLENYIPTMIQSITDEVRREFIVWLKELAAHGSSDNPRYCKSHADIGAHVMNRLSTRLNRDLQSRTKTLGRRNSSVSLKPRKKTRGESGRSRGQSIALQTMDRQDDDDMLFEANLFEEVKVDFSPVYHCLNIYEHLHMADQVQTLYMDKRLHQLTQACDKLCGGFEHLDISEGCARIAGFFIVEDTVLKTCHQLLPRAHVEHAWEEQLERLVEALRDVFCKTSIAEDFLKKKYTLILFSKTLEGLGFYVTPILELLSSVQTELTRCLHIQFKADIAQVLSQEKYEPLQISDSKSYAAQVLAFELQDPSLNVEFPVTMPFSITVPAICEVMKTFVKGYVEYFHHLKTDDVESRVHEAVDQALTILNDTIHKMIQPQHSLHISQCVQLSLNAYHIADYVCPFLSKYIQAKVSQMPGTASIYKIPIPVEECKRLLEWKSAERLRVTANTCEGFLFELVPNKIDSFMELSGFKWAPTQIMTQPSDYISDLVRYLESILPWMSFVSTAVRDGVHFMSCKHICSALMDQLMGPGVKTFNIIGVYNLNIDLKELEAFAERCMIPNLPETFSEIRQLINLFLSGNVEQILDPHTRQNEYKHLSPEKLTKIMDK